MDIYLKDRGIPSVSDFLAETLKNRGTMPQVFDIGSIISTISSHVAKNPPCEDDALHFYAQTSDETFANHLSSEPHIFVMPIGGEPDPGHIFNISGLYQANIRRCWASDRLGDWMDSHGAVIGDIYHHIRLEHSVDDFIVYEMLDLKMWSDKGFPECRVEMSAEFGYDGDEEFFRLERTDSVPRYELFRGPRSLKYEIFWRNIEGETKELATEVFLKGKALARYRLFLESGKKDRPSECGQESEVIYPDYA